MLRGWERVLAEGAARYAVHLVGRPEIKGMVYGLDLRETHGIVLTLSVFAQQQASGGAVLPPELTQVTPRFATLRKDERALIVEVDDAMTQILGWSREEMVGHRSTEFIHPEDHALAIDNWMETLASPGFGRRVRLRHRRRDGSWVWLEATNHNLLDDPAHGCVVSEMVDISEEMAAHEELRAREQLLDGVAEAIPVGLFQVNVDRQIVYTNDRLHEILGVERADSIEAQLSPSPMRTVHCSDAALDQVLAQGVALRHRGRAAPGGHRRAAFLHDQPARSQRGRRDDQRRDRLRRRHNRQRTHARGAQAARDVR